MAPSVPLPTRSKSAPSGGVTGGFSRLQISRLPTRIPSAPTSPVKSRLPSGGFGRLPSLRWRQRDPSPSPEQQEAALGRLQIALKPFGKSGVRVGYTLHPALLADGSRISIEWRERCAPPDQTWREQCVLVHSGKTSGFTVVKAVGGATPASAPAPRELSWRLRSSASELSEATWLGKPVCGSPGKLARGASMWRGTGARTATPGAGCDAAAQPTGSGGGLANTVACGAPSREALMQLVVQREGEVECLLRVELKDAASVAAAGARVEKALAFDERLETLAAGATKGPLFQALLEALREQGAAHVQLDNSSKNLFGGELSASREFGLDLVTWASLMCDADALRQLVRIKVADDNDLRTARSGLTIAADFFDALNKLGEMGGTDAWQALQDVRMSA
jgi:hypothetical protein